MDVVIYAVGSPIVADLEEGLARAGIGVAAAVRNIEGETLLLERSRLVARDALTPALTALPFLVPLFTPAHRMAAAEEARTAGFHAAYTFTDPSVPLPVSAALAPGVWINVGCTLGAAVRLGEFALVNRAASIGHHARLGAFSSVGPGAVLAGQVTLGRGAVVGAGAVVLPERAVGDNAVVAAGAVVTRDVPARALVMGSPARVVREGIGGYADRGLV